MSGETSLTLLDGVVLFVLLLALARGIFIGLIRESFSIAALGASVLAVRFGTQILAGWLVTITGEMIGPGIAPWLAGAVLAITTVVIVGMIGRLIQRGIKLAGLSWLDRSGGAVLGLTEGLLLAMVIILGTTLVLGREHPSVQTSRSLALYDTARAYLAESIDDLSIPSADEWF